MIKQADGGNTGRILVEIDSLEFVVNVGVSSEKNGVRHAVPDPGAKCFRCVLKTACAVPIFFKCGNGSNVNPRGKP